jgi:uncharacterized protein YecT (DUF1311 family)
MKYAFILPLIFPMFLYGADVCHNITTSEQVFLCSKNKREKADKYLNEQYLLLLSKINSVYVNDDLLKQEFLNKTKMAQRAWLKFRDANCEIYSFQIDSKTQAYQTSLNECITKMSESRGRELSEISNSI